MTILSEQICVYLSPAVYGLTSSGQEGRTSWAFPLFKCLFIMFIIILKFSEIFEI